MQIDPKSAARVTPSVAPSTAPAERGGEAVKGVSEATTFLPSTALANLLAQMRVFPEVRDDVIRQVRERLAKGDLLTPASTAAVAAAILGTESHGE